jgi:cytochrome c biogenesis protein CcdA
VSDLQRSDADQVRVDDLYLDVTLVTPSFLQTRNLQRYLGDHSVDAVLPVLVGLNTHTGDIGHMHRFPGTLALIGPHGDRYPAISEPIVVSQHHNAYMLLFPARSNRGVPFLEEGSGTLVIEATNMGQRTLRRFEWTLPVADTGMAGDGTLAGRLMLGVALLAALLVVLSPCALELTLYYTAIISCTVTEGEREAAGAGPLRAGVVGRRRVLVNLAAFVSGFTLLYAASGATVGLIGAGVREPLGEYGNLIQLFGGSVILLFALRVAGVDRWILRHLPGGRGGAPTAAVAHGAGKGPLAWLRGGFTALRTRGQARAAAGGLRARDSFLVGMGLSSACLSCMGGAVLYPLLVYAGITSWLSGMITLGLYSLAIAVPMVLIALGFFRIRLSLTRRVGVNRVLRFASAAMLACIALLILFGQERILTDWTFRLLGQVQQWTA